MPPDRITSWGSGRAALPDLRDHLRLHWPAGAEELLQQPAIARSDELAVSEDVELSGVAGFKRDADARGEGLPDGRSETRCAGSIPSRRAVDDPDLDGADLHDGTSRAWRGRHLESRSRRVISFLALPRFQAEENHGLCRCLRERSRQEEKRDHSEKRD